MSGPGAMNLDTAHFLARHWQREPLLIRNAIPGFASPASADELAGLALEAEVESRIVEQRDGEWQLFHGPFTESDFQRQQPWTLLVQAVDHYLPAVAQLRRWVDFVPQWRVDDIMASYAVDGGSVGPHFDNYDVFLLQGEGQRLWQLGQCCGSQSALLSHDELRILSDFEVSAEYLLDPGDVLYLPPGLAHWGIARGECTTFSIGFRAPRLNDLLSRFVDSVLAEMDPELFYTDAGLSAAARPGEIRAQDLDRVQEQIMAALDAGSAGDRRWLGELVTEPRYEISPDDDSLAESRALLRQPGESVTLAPAARLAWQPAGREVIVYANGESRLFPSALDQALEALCGERVLSPAQLAATLERPEGVALLDYLLEAGCIYVQ